MAEPAPGKLKGWLKAGIGTAGGLVSGAAVMYVTAAFNSVVKPAKPVANFKAEPAGLSVRFQNLSGKGSQGWWDFGDGSPLEPVSPEHEYVTHAYARPGEYTVKMSLHNLLGEETERSVTVHLDAPAGGDEPRVGSLQLIPVSPGSFAPATFRLVSDVSNAQLCILDLGEDRPLEVLADPGAARDRLVTFQRPGGHLVKLVAISGTKHAEKSDIATVEEPPAGTVTAVLQVSDEATKLQTQPRPVPLSVVPPREFAKGGPIDRTLQAMPNGLIADVAVLGPDGKELARMTNKAELALDAVVKPSGARNLKLQMAADRKSVRLTGEFVAGGKAPPPVLMLPLVLIEQQPVKDYSSGIADTAAVALPASSQPSSCLLRLPAARADWTDVRRKARLELRDGDAVLKAVDLGGQPVGGTLALLGRNYRLSATCVGDQVRVDLVPEAAFAAPPAAH
jgi:hypothetical protein